jgi:hypothetical protein
MEREAAEEEQQGERSDEMHPGPAEQGGVR